MTSLRRPVAPSTICGHSCGLFRELRAFRPHIVHTHMAKAGLLGRLATAAYNVTARIGAARARRAHLSRPRARGLFPPVVVAHVHRARAAAGPRQRPHRRHFAAHPRRAAATATASAATRSTAVVPLGFDLARVCRDRRGDARGARRATRTSRRGGRRHDGRTADGDQAARSCFWRRSRLVSGAPSECRRPDRRRRRAARRARRATPRALGIADRVRWLGWRRDLATVYAATDVFLLTSRNEGTPVALIEAMASGVPGVSTDVGGVSDVIGERRRRSARRRSATRRRSPPPSSSCCADRRLRAAHGCARPRARARALRHRPAASATSTPLYRELLSRGR